MHRGEPARPRFAAALQRAVDLNAVRWNHGLSMARTADRQLVELSEEDTSITSLARLWSRFSLGERSCSRALSC